MVLVALLALSTTLTTNIPRLELSPSRSSLDLVRQWVKEGENDLCVHIWMCVYLRVYSKCNPKEYNLKCPKTLILSPKTITLTLNPIPPNTYSHVIDSVMNFFAKINNRAST